MSTFDALLARFPGDNSNQNLWWLEFHAERKFANDPFNSRFIYSILTAGCDNKAFLNGLYGARCNWRFYDSIISIILHNDAKMAMKLLYLLSHGLKHNLYRIYTKHKPVLINAAAMIFINSVDWVAEDMHEIIATARPDFINAFTQFTAAYYSIVTDKKISDYVIVETIDNFKDDAGFMNLVMKRPTFAKLYSATNTAKNRETRENNVNRENNAILTNIGSEQWKSLIVDKFISCDCYKLIKLSAKNELLKSELFKFNEITSAKIYELAIINDDFDIIADYDKYLINDYKYMLNVFSVDAWSNCALEIVKKIQWPELEPMFIHSVLKTKNYNFIIYFCADYDIRAHIGADRRNTINILRNIGNKELYDKLIEKLELAEMMN